MKKLLFILAMVSLGLVSRAQTIYYWVGSAPSANHNFTTGSNWNTSIDGTGNSRPSSTGASDILIFDGTNLGGTTPTTGPVTVNVNGSITCAQMKFVNNADISIVRPTSGTSTVTFAGEVDDDFIIEAGSSLSFISTIGSIRMNFGATNTGRVEGTLRMYTTFQARFDNTTGGSPHMFRFKPGSKFYTNITSSSSSYAFGSSSQSSERWVLFETGSEIYYDGGFSPVGNNSTFTAIEMMPGTVWHHRASNPTSGAGSFFTRRSFGSIIVENNATLTADGPIYRIEDLTIEAGSSFETHSSGQTVVTGDLVVDGLLNSDPSSSNKILFAGAGSKSVTGTGTISVGGIIVGGRAHVNVHKDITVHDGAVVYGTLNMNGYQMLGAGTFSARAANPTVAATVNTTDGSFLITGNTTIPTSALGYSITGAGIPGLTTMIVAFSTTGDTIYLSAPATATASGVAVNVETLGAILENNNVNGYDPATGTIVVSGTQNFEDGISYIVNGATSWPLGISTGDSPTPINSLFLQVTAPVTLNRSISLSESITIGGKLTVPEPLMLHLKPLAAISVNNYGTDYIVTGYDVATGNQGVVLLEGVDLQVLLPIGTANYFLPLSITTNGMPSDFKVSVFEGITVDGTVNGTSLTPTEKLTVIDAVWNVSRISGSGFATLEFGWDAALEGATFATLPNSDIGPISNNGTAWMLPTGFADNTTNSGLGDFDSFHAFSIGAVPQVDPFVFNPIPDKIYGDPDFNGGATSLNTTQPIVYTSSNPAVATIVAGDIHISGAGTTDITATQATDGVYPAVSVTHTLTVVKAPLTITADDKLKFEGLPNPTLTATYSGFVLGEDESVLLTPAVLSTTATTGSAPGTYPITVTGATSNNYEITFVDGVLTVQAKQPQVITFNEIPVKTYGNADFAAGATSTNNTIPITFTSSDPGVATVSGGIIHIVGAGTTTITASQAGNDGYFPATDVARELVVNKANLTITVRDTSKVQGEPNPPFTITYSGFVLGETAADLNSPVVVSTDANENSTPGVYAIVPTGGATQNYEVALVEGKLTVLPASGIEDIYLNAFMKNGSVLTVRVFSPVPALADILLYDMHGRLVLKKNLFMPEGLISNDINVDRLAAGIYVIALRGDGVNVSKQVILAK